MPMFAELLINLQFANHPSGVCVCVRACVHACVCGCVDVPDFLDSLQMSKLKRFPLSLVGAMFLW